MEEYFSQKFNLKTFQRRSPVVGKNAVVEDDIRKEKSHFPPFFLPTLKPIYFLYIVLNVSLHLIAFLTKSYLNLIEGRCVQLMSNFNQTHTL